MRPFIILLVTLAAGGCGRPHANGGDGGATRGGDGGGVGGGGGAGGGDLGATCGAPDDAHHCGSCDNDCTALHNVDARKVTCVAGVCQLAGACQTNFADCNGALADGCEADLSHPDHCGTCATSCSAATPLCANADGNYACVASCSGTANAECGMSCVDEKSDPEHCGSCLACPTTAHGVAQCVNASCYLQCDPGYELFNGQCMKHTAGWALESINGYAPRLSAVWGSGPNDVYVVGDMIIAHSTGDGSWTVQLASPQTATKFTGVWASGPNDIYAVGGHAIMHSDGKGTWVNQAHGTSDSFTAVWGSGPGDVYVIGSSLWHSTGNGTWTVQAGAPAGTALWGSGAHDIYGLSGGNILHSTGDGNWSTQNFPLSLNALCGSGAGDVYAVGNMVLHTTGDQTWTQQSTPSSLQLPLNGCFVAAPGDIYATVDGHHPIVHSTGLGDWTPVGLETGYYGDPLPIYLSAMWGASAKNVYAVGNGAAAQIAHLY